MPDDPRRRIIERANRMLRQSETLRKIGDELLAESNDLKKAVKRLRKRRATKKR